MELEDTKYYSFGTPGEGFRGDFLLWFKDQYFAHPPTQAELDKLWDEWETKRTVNRRQLTDTLFLRVYEDYIHVYDVVNPRISVAYGYPPKKMTKRFLDMFSQEIIAIIRRRGVLSLIH